MPVIQVKALPQRPGTDVSDVSRRISTGLAKATGIPPAHIWVTWETIPSWHYVEGDRAAAIQPEDTHPPIVRVKIFEGRSREEIEKILSRTAELVTENLGIEDGNVLVHYEELPSGYVHSGGKVLRRPD